MHLPTFTHPSLGVQDVADRLTEAGFDLSPSRPTQRTLLDTFDGRLHAAGLRLELRDGGTRQLILSDGGATPAQVTVDAAPTSGGSLPAGPFGARLRPVIEIRALLPVLTVSARRVSAVRRDARGKTHVVVVLQDHLGVDGTTLTSPGWTVEIEELEGYAKAAREVRDLLGSLGLAECASDVLALAAIVTGVDLRGYDGSPTVPLDRREAALDGFRRVFAKLADAIDANWAGCVDDVDPEFLHDLRVAVRRTRSVLAQAHEVLPPGERTRMRSELGWLGAATGAARDLDVFAIEWDGYVSALGPPAAHLLDPVLAQVSERRAAAHATLADVLRSDRARTLIDGWRASLAAGLPAGEGQPEADRPLGPVVAERVAADQGRLVARGRMIVPGSPPSELHTLRKDAKRLRYLLECFGGVFAGKPRKLFVQRLKALQDNLGEHNDADVHTSQLVDLSQDLHGHRSTTAETLLAVGRLTEHLDQRRRAAQDDFAQQFAAYDTKRMRRTSEDLLRSAAGR
ncbi:MAG: CHAD domain-containing protein [Actinomycetota bacterium]|nr:CHAD domain-containing protein [Actinomycetota bacterium]